MKKARFIKVSQEHQIMFVSQNLNCLRYDILFVEIEEMSHTSGSTYEEINFIDVKKINRVIQENFLNLLQDQELKNSQKIKC